MRIGTNQRSAPPFWLAEDPLAQKPIAQVVEPRLRPDDSQRFSLIGVLISATSVLYAASIIVVYGSISAIFAKLEISPRGIFTIEDIALLSIDLFSFSLGASAAYWYIPLAIYCFFLIRPVVEYSQAISLGRFAHFEPWQEFSAVGASQLSYVMLLSVSLLLNWIFDWGGSPLLITMSIAGILFAGYYAVFRRSVRQYADLEVEALGAETIVWRAVINAKLFPAAIVMFAVLLYAFVDTAHGYRLRPLDIGLLVSPQVCSGGKDDYQALMWRGTANSVVICTRSKSVVIVSQHENLVSDTMPLRRKDFDPMALLRGLEANEYNWMAAGERDANLMIDRERDAQSWRTWQKLTREEKEEVLRTGPLESRPTMGPAPALSIKEQEKALRMARERGDKGL